MSAPTYTQEDLEHDIQTLRRIAFPQHLDRQRFDDLIVQASSEALLEMIPALSILRQAGRRGRQLIGFILLYFELRAIAGNLANVDSTTLVVLSEDDGGFKESRFQRAVELVWAHRRVTMPDLYPTVVVKKGEKHPGYEMVRTQLRPGVAILPQQARALLEPLEEETIQEILASIGVVIEVDEALRCKFVIQVMDFNGGRYPGISTIRLKDIQFNRSGAPFLILVTLPGRKNKRRAHLTLSPDCAATLMEILTEQAKAVGYTDVVLFVVENGDRYLLPDPRTVDEVPLQTNTLVSWFERLGNLHLGRPLCRRHFRITSFTRDAANGVPLERLQAAKGQGGDYRSTPLYIKFRMPHLKAQRRRMDGQRIQYPRCSSCKKPNAEPSKPCAHCAAVNLLTADPIERSLNSFRRAGELAYQVKVGGLA